MSPGRNVGSSATGVVTRPKVCVRLCDGRYFPVQRHSGVGSAKSCSSFCPASATKIYNGNSINHAVAPDGKRYSELPARLCIGRGSSLAAPAMAGGPNGHDLHSHQQLCGTLSGLAPPAHRNQNRAGRGGTCTTATRPAGRGDVRPQHQEQAGSGRPLRPELVRASALNQRTNNHRTDL